MRRATYRMFVALSAGALVAAACGAGSGDLAEPATTTVSTTTTMSTTTSASTTIASVESAPAPTDEQPPTERSITYLGVTYDQPDLRAMEIGGAGFWFAQFDAPLAVEGAPTGERAVDALPPWVAPFNHFSFAYPDPGEGCTEESFARGCTPGFGFRTFSQDGPSSSAGGIAEWSVLTLPDGRAGRSGAIVDPNTEDNSNNTVNRIQLREGVPATFYFHVVTDNTARTHDPTGTVRARANVGLFDLDDQVEPDVLLGACDLVFNGVPDVYTFRFDGFAADDYIKLRLAGAAGSGGASFAGLLFDETFDSSDLQFPSDSCGPNS